MSEIVNVEGMKHYLAKTNISKFNQHLERVWHSNYVKVYPISIEEIQAKCSKMNKNCRNTSHIYNNAILVWRKGQYKLFTWFVALYCYTQNKKIQHLNEDDFTIVSTVFPQHSRERIKYEIYCLIPFKSHSRKKWTGHQISLLSILIQKEGCQIDKIQWKSVSYKLYEQSQGQYIRTFKECRQRWINHANPDLNKDKWSLEEDYKLFKQVAINGKKWSRIAKQFKTQRTEHMIKNRYNSLIQREQSTDYNLSISQLQAIILQKLKIAVEQGSQTNSSNLQINLRNIIVQEIKQLQIIQFDCSNEYGDVFERQNQNTLDKFSNYDGMNVEEEKQERVASLWNTIDDQLNSRHDKMLEEWKFRLQSVQEIRVLRNQLLDKLSFSWGQAFMPYIQQEQRQIMYNDEDSLW